jgi:hypothetical protein
VPDFEFLRKIFSEVRRQSSITGTIVNVWCRGSVNVHGSQVLDMRNLWE